MDISWRGTQLHCVIQFVSIHISIVHLVHSGKCIFSLFKCNKCQQDTDEILGFCHLSLNASVLHYVKPFAVNENKLLVLKSVIQVAQYIVL